MNREISFHENAKIYDNKVWDIGFNIITQTAIACYITISDYLIGGKKPEEKWLILDVSD